MSQRSDWRGSPDANSTRLALRTCSMVATNSDSLSRCVLRCPGRRCCRSALIPSAQTAIPLVPPTCRSRSRKEAETLNHTQIPAVNRGWGKLMDGEGDDLGSQATARAADGLVLGSAPGATRLLVCGNDGAVNPD